MSVRIYAFAICVLLCLYALDAVGQEKSDPMSSPQEDSLKQALKAYIRQGGDPDQDQTTKYIAAFRDLNGDGKPEAIVYLESPDYCGSGGCNTLILTNKNGTWKVMSSILITRPPIRVLPNTSHGWHSIGVFVVGGGILDGYEAELDFNGKKYPLNPTVPPAKPLKSPAGDIVIKSIQDAKPLY
jgi:hypothetical protein